MIFEIPLQTHWNYLF